MRSVVLALILGVSLSRVVRAEDDGDLCSLQPFNLKGDWVLTLPVREVVPMGRPVASDGTFDTSGLTQDQAGYVRSEFFLRARGPRGRTNITVLDKTTGHSQHGWVFHSPAEQEQFLDWKRAGCPPGQWEIDQGAYEAQARQDARMGSSGPPPVRTESSQRTAERLRMSTPATFKARMRMDESYKTTGVMNVGRSAAPAPREPEPDPEPDPAPEPDPEPAALDTEPGAPAEATGAEPASSQGMAVIGGRKKPRRP